jgi:hypothetical protein
MNAVEVLIAARKQLTDKGWTKGVFARDDQGRSVNARSEQAACYCIAGAIRSVEDDDNAAIDARVFLRKAGDYVALVEFNDDCKSVDEVLALIDRAITIAEETAV